MYVQLAPIQLKPGVEEKALVKASDTFQRTFVETQPGILRRFLVRSKAGGYADLVFFATKEDADRVAQAESDCDAFAAFLHIMEPPDPGLVDMGVASFELVKAYESGR